MHPGWSGGIARTFINSKLTPLMVVASILLGAVAIFLLPREEEPQIRVPMVDIVVSMPGATAREMEERVLRPLEGLLWEISGVEYIYSTARPGDVISMVRFRVGDDVEKSLVKLNAKLRANSDRLPPGATAPMIMPRSIDDVPILALTLHAPHLDHLTLRRAAVEVEAAVKHVPQVAETRIIGGASRQIRVKLDSAGLSARGLSAQDVVTALASANSARQAGRLIDADQTVLVESGPFLQDAHDVQSVVVSAVDGKPVYVRDIAEVADTSADPTTYTFFGTHAGEEPSVTVCLAKRPGANAIDVSHAVLAQVKALQERSLPHDLSITVTRDYGETAAEKSNELLLHMGIAVGSVVLLILLLLGWRASLIVLIAIPTTLSLTMLVLYLCGYSLNRITLFALTFSIGILVDDAIVVVENIYRRLGLPGSDRQSLADTSLEAVAEVGNPVILATLAVIAAIIPMGLVGGLMGPYMGPIPVGASAAMAFSLLVAFIVTPWAAIRVLRHSSPSHDVDHTLCRFSRAYRGLMQPLLRSWGWRLIAFGLAMTVLMGAMMLVPMGLVNVKMLPFDNKSEFQVLLNMPEGTPLERTTAVIREMAASIAGEPEVTNYQVYAGTASPFNFNGLVRHYFSRSGDHVADLQVNLLPRDLRRGQSHDIAKRVRPRLAAIAAAAGGRLTISEVPPGPPVLQTLVAEVYAPTDEDRHRLAEEVKRVFKSTNGVVDVDWYMGHPQPLVRFRIDKQKAGLAGVSALAVTDLIHLAMQGTAIGLAHQPREREDLPIIVEYPATSLFRSEDILDLRVRGREGLLPLREIGTLEHSVLEQSIYHKNLIPVTYVVGDVAGVVESPAYAIFAMNEALSSIDATAFGGADAHLRVLNAASPPNDYQPTIKWDGEWHITLEVFTDMGLAFAGCIVLMYVLMVGWFKSFMTPLVVMIVIPFSLVGVLPAHAGWGAFFTATSMIGFMAGAGIVVRNSVILVDFIEAELASGKPLEEAAMQAAIVRFRPMLLTALAVTVGASIILADPIFQGLALSLMAGSLASLLIAPVLVPLLYVLQRRWLG